MKRRSYFFLSGRKKRKRIREHEREDLCSFFWPTESNGELGEEEKRRGIKKK